MRNDVTMPPSILPRPELAEYPAIGADGFPPVRRSRTRRWHRAQRPHPRIEG